jgi:hypothetical protein
MKFVRILQRGFLDTASVLILVVRGGVRHGFDCLRVLSVGAVWLGVSHRVEAVRVARLSGDQCGGGIRAASPTRSTTGGMSRPWWASVGLCTEERTSARLGRWRSFGPWPIEEMKKAFYFFQIFSKFQTNFNWNQIWILMTSTRTIKYKSTSPPQKKYASAWNTINIIIYLYK